MVVNPNSGPGNESLPNQQYREAIAHFGKYTNVELLGYVRTDYARRNIDDVIRDINVYSGWQQGNSSITMGGIFLDEAPHQYSPDAVDFMRRLGREIKGANGLREPRKVKYFRAFPQPLRRRGCNSPPHNKRSRGPLGQGANRRPPQPKGKPTDKDA